MHTFLIPMPEETIDTSSEESHEIQTVDRRTYLKLASTAGTGLGIGVGTGAVSSELLSHARTANGSIIEDFNYSSTSDMKDYYYFDRGESYASLDTISSTPTSDASESVLAINGGNAKMIAYDDDDGYDLQAYPQIGDTIVCWLRGANGTENMNVLYGAVDGDSRDDHYYVKVNMESSLLGMGVVNDGSSSWLATAPEDPPFSSNAWYRLEVQWNDGSPNTHDVTLYDQNGSSLASFTYDGSDSADPNFEGRGFGYSAFLGTSSEVAYFDFANKDGENNGSSGENYAVIDDFEDGDLSEYTHDPTRSGSASVVSSSGAPVYDGTNALEINGEHAELISRDGLNTYPVAGDRFSYWFQLTGGAINGVVNITYGVQDHENRYYVQLDEGSHLRFAKLQNNTADWFDHTSVSCQEGVWYELEITWDENGDQTAVLYDESRNRLANVFGTDSTWTGGGIGYDGYLSSSGGSVYFDYITKDGLNYQGTDQITATRYDITETQYSVSENDHYQITSTIRCTGGYPKSNGRWGTTFRNSAYGVARRYNPSTETPKQGTNISVIDGHSISYTDADDGNQSTFAYKYDTGYVGGWPTPQATALEIAEATLEAFFEVTIGELSKRANALLTAKDIYDNVKDTINENESTIEGENREFVWWYGDGWTSDEHSDVCHFSEVDYEQEYDSTSTFYIESAMTDGTVNPKVNWRVDVEAPTSAQSTSTASSYSGDPARYSEETRKKFGLRKIPLRDLKKVGIELEDPLIVDGDKVWFATNPQVTFSPV